jgi:nucleoside triphosphate diphosphatase
MEKTNFDSQSAIEKLKSLMTMLRDKNFGCPWDLEQTIASLVPYTLEEAYEVVDAIEKADMVELEDELGDLLFQVVFYAQIAKEQGLFQFDDVANAITKKLIRRHPHVFPEGKVTNFGSKSEISSGEVIVNWEAIKQIEKAEKIAKNKGDLKSKESNSALDDVPRALPALDRARKLQKRAARVGFDWSEMTPVLAKLKEEVMELEEAIASKDREAVEAELGDVLFAAVNVARHSDIYPEVALRQANSRFENRFKWIESSLEEQGKSMDDTDLQQLDQLWDQAKAKGL